MLLKINGEPIRPPVQPVFRMAAPTEFTIRKRDGQVLSAPATTPKPISGKRPIAEPRPLSVSKLKPGVGYIKIRIFPGAVGIDLAADIDKAVAEIADCDRLILDLRGNTGGGIGGMRMMSYLTPDKTPIGYSLTRRRAQNGFKREKLTRFGRIPRHKIALVWLIVRYASAIVDQSICLVTEGLGPQRFHGPSRYLGQRAQCKRSRDACCLRTGEQARHNRRHENSRTTAERQSIPRRGGVHAWPARRCVFHLEWRTS